MSVTARQTVDMHVVAAVDKFKGTATAAQIARSIGHACWELGFDCDEIALADGGEGTLDVLGGPNRESTVTGPLGDSVQAAWRFQHETAVIEMARASGLSLVGGAEGNDPVAASTSGVGELIDRALDLGAKRIIVCLGGSATTDGGLGAVRAIHAPNRLRAVEFLIACDVTTPFLDAATVFAPQKGATRGQVKLLTSRLERVAQMYRETHGVDVTTLEGAGAAGGLAGGLAALGGRIVPGFDLVADEVNLYDRLQRADVVITGEGRLDATSYDGKVVGSVIEVATSYDKRVGGIFGVVDLDDPVDADLPRPDPCVSLTQMFGEDKAINEPLWCVERAALDILRSIQATRT